MRVYSIVINTNNVIESLPFLIMKYIGIMLLPNLLGAPVRNVGTGKEDLGPQRFHIYSALKSKIISLCLCNFKSRVLILLCVYFLFLPYNRLRARLLRHDFRGRSFQSINKLFKRAEDGADEVLNSKVRAFKIKFDICLKPIGFEIGNLRNGKFGSLLELLFKFYSFFTISPRTFPFYWSKPMRLRMLM